MASLESIQTSSKSSTSPCPTCSGNGNCSSSTATKCTCNAGYTLDDCSVKTEDFDQVVTLKNKILEDMSNTIKDLEDPESRE